ncbi:MAG TPA: hypothetical protein VHV76_01420, partial [Mycobacteriales bacterium]|nr:hypothetical protein [Mycobacteriales bacterium]
AAEPPKAEPTWPCFNCGVTVPMSEDHCPVCGAGFLAPASQGHSLRVPIFGDVGRLASGQKLMLGILVTLGLIVLLVLLFTIGGAVF